MITLNPQPISNYQGTKLYLGVFLVRQTTSGVRAIYHGHHDAAENEVFLLANKFNFSLKYVNLRHDLKPYILINTHKLKYFYEDLNFIGICRTVKYYVIYCRRHEVLDASWVVWFTPFSPNAWLTLCLTILMLAFTQKLNSFSDFVEELAFLFAILIRQPTRDLDACKYLVFAVVAGTILPSLYEAIITGKIISPSPPTEFQNLGDFINASYKLSFNGDSSGTFYWMGQDSGILYEFKRYNVLDKINSSTVIIHDLEAKNEFRRLVNEEQLTGVMVIGESTGGLTKLEMYQGKTSSLKEHYPCSQFSLGGYNIEFIFLYVPFVKEGLQFHKFLFQSGLINQWTKLENLLELQKMMPKCDATPLVVKLHNLVKFLSVCDILLGLSGVTMILEVIFVRFL